MFLSAMREISSCDKKKIVSDLRQVGGILRFPSPIKLTATI